MKDNNTSQLLEDTMAAFDVQHRVVTMTPDEYRQTDVIDHGADYKLIGMTAVDAVTCIFFDYPDTVRDQVKFIIRMLSVYRNSYWGYSDVYMYRFDSVQYVPMYDHIRGLVAAEHDIAGLGFHLTHSDAKRSFQYEGKELEKLKLTVTNALPDNSQETYDSVSRCIDRMLRIRRRRIARYRYCGDETGTDVKWRPVHESILDDIDCSVLKRDYQDIQSDVRPDSDSLLNYKYMFAFCGIGENDVELITERICEIMGVDVQVKAWTMDEFRQQREYIAQTNNTDFETEFLVCVFVKNLPASTYMKVKFIIRMASALMHDYDLMMDVLKYVNRTGEKFEFEKYKTNTLRYAFYFDGYLQKLKYGIGVDRKAIDYEIECLRGNIIELLYDNVSLYDESHNAEVDAVLNKMVERATHGNRSLLESVLDNLDRSDIEHEDII